MKTKPTPKNPTRAEEQARIDDLFRRGDLDAGQWRILTDELSDLARWNAAGRVAAEKV